MKHVEEVDIEDALDLMSEEAIACRDFSHAWKPHTASRVQGGYERALRCASCGTLRVEALDTWGGLVSRHYDYPENYLVPGMGRVTGSSRDRLRLASLTRLVGDKPKPKTRKPKKKETDR